MRVGVIAEGPADLAVIVNVLKGKLGLEFEDVQFLRPEYALDETDLHEQAEGRFSNWGLVKRECVEGTKIEEFLNSPIDEERLVVIHLDTAEAELVGYDVKRPSKQDAADYASDLRALVSAKVEEWLGTKHDRVRHAIAVEETDAWVLTIFSQKETSGHADPKRQLEKALHKPNAFRDKERTKLFQLKPYKRYAKLTQPFRKLRDLEACACRNKSLALFIDSL